MKKADTFFMGSRGGVKYCRRRCCFWTVGQDPPCNRYIHLSRYPVCKTIVVGWGLPHRADTTAGTNAEKLRRSAPSPRGGGAGTPMKKADAFFMGSRGGVKYCRRCCFWTVGQDPPYNRYIHLPRYPVCKVVVVTPHPPNPRKKTIDLFPNQAKAYVFWNLYPCPHPGPPPRGREPFCGRFK